MNSRFYGIKTEFIIKDFEECKDIIFMFIINSKKYEFSLLKQNIKAVPTFIAPEYICSKNIEFDLKLITLNMKSHFSNKLFSYKEAPLDIVLTKDFSINSSYFKLVKNIRNIDKRPVWIFYGNSGLGKSYLASLIFEQKSIYETDSSNILPDIIYSDIIVVGNKYKYSLEEIKNRIYGNTKVIEVNFN